MEHGLLGCICCDEPDGLELFQFQLREFLSRASERLRAGSRTLERPGSPHRQRAGRDVEADDEQRAGVRAAELTPLAHAERRDLADRIILREACSGVGASSPDAVTGGRRGGATALRASFGQRGSAVVVRSVFL